MKIKTPYFYKDFKCIAGDCTDTCCAGWEVDVDADSAKYYSGVQGEFGERIKEVMVLHEDGEANFTLKKNGWCPFLNNKLLCDLYTALGEEHLCETCAQFPRFYAEYGGTLEIGLALSCITAGKLILGSDKPLTFVVEDDGKGLSHYNNIDPVLFLYLSNARQLFYNIARDRSVDVNTRYWNILRLSASVQEGIDKKSYIKNNQVRGEIKPYEQNRDYRAYRRDLWKLFDGLEIIKESWTKRYTEIVEVLYGELSDEEYYDLCEEFDEYIKPREYEYEHLLMYCLYRYFLKGVHDGKVLNKVRFAMLAYICIRDMGIMSYRENKELPLDEQIEIMHLYSREVEHSYENYEEIMKLLEDIKMN